MTVVHNSLRYVILDITPREGPTENLMLIAVIANLLMRQRPKNPPAEAERLTDSSGLTKGDQGPLVQVSRSISMLEQPPHDEQNEQWAVPSPCCWRLACLSVQVGSWGALFISSLDQGCQVHLFARSFSPRFACRPPPSSMSITHGLLTNLLHNSSRASFRLASLAHLDLHESGEPTANLDSFGEPGFPPEQATPAKTTRMKLSP